LKDQTARADGYCISAPSGENGTGVAVLNCHLKGPPVLRPRHETKDFGMEAAPYSPLPDLSRSCYARPSPVVVLQDGTVGTVMVPKQT